MKDGGLKYFTTWICQKEIFVPNFVLQLFHHALLLNQVLANYLNKVGVLHNYIYFQNICH